MDCGEGPPRVSASTCSPPGLEARVSVRLRGPTSRDAVVVAPRESVQVRLLHHHWSGSTSPTVGIWKLPPLTPGNCTPGCVCVLWWNTMSQKKPLAGRVPSSASVQSPAKLTTSPPLYRVPAGGATMEGGGGGMFGGV